MPATSVVGLMKSDRRPSPLHAWWVLVLLVAVSACGSQIDAQDPEPAVTVDLGSPIAFDLAPAHDPTLHPQGLLLERGPGRVISSMELYTIVWQGDESTGEKAQRMMARVLKSDYWVETLAQY